MLSRFPLSSVENTPLAAWPLVPSVYAILHPASVICASSWIYSPLIRKAREVEALCDRGVRLEGDVATIVPLCVFWSLLLL